MIEAVPVRGWVEFLDDLPREWPFTSSRTVETATGRIVLTVRRAYRISGSETILTGGLTIKATIPAQEFVPECDLSKRFTKNWAAPAVARAMVIILEKSERALDLAIVRMSVARLFASMPEGLRSAARNHAKRTNKTPDFIFMAKEDCRYWHEWVEIESNGA